MPAEDFGPLIWLKDDELAELFGVPVEQAWVRRLELELPSVSPGPPP